MFVKQVLLLLLGIVALLRPSGVSSLDEEDVDVESRFGGSIDQSRISELGRFAEENLNCFLQLDESLADKWSVDLSLRGEQDFESGTINEVITQENNILTAESLGSCMKNLTKKVRGKAVEKCMINLISSEIESEGFISAPELFDSSLPLPALTFLDIRDLAKLLFKDRTWQQLTPEELNAYQTASGYLLDENNGDSDQVFIIDQECEWRNLVALKNRERDREEMLKEFREQVIRLISHKVGHAVLDSKHLKPGTWISIYRRWTPVRSNNLKELETLITDLKTGRFTTLDLCKYATTLGDFFANQEIEIILPNKVSPLKLIIGELDGKVTRKEGRICAAGNTEGCRRIRELKKSYREDIKCMERFGALLSNHLLNSISEKYADVQPKITYPELVCKKSPKAGKISIRYCRCMGSFCTSRDVGDIKATYYKINNEGNALVFTGA